MQDDRPLQQGPSGDQLIEMEANEYQRFTDQTAVYMDTFPEVDKYDLEIIYLVLGFVEEVGEIAGKLKKALRKGTRPTELVGDPTLEGEWGDAGWYFARGALKMGFKLTRVFGANKRKLLDRKARGVLKGEGLEGGDNR